MPGRTKIDPHVCGESKARFATSMLLDFSKILKSIYIVCSLSIILDFVLDCSKILTGYDRLPIYDGCYRCWLSFSRPYITHLRWVPGAIKGA